MDDAKTTDFAKSFEWQQEYDAILQRIAQTDIVDTEWGRLRDMIKYKINNNVRQYLSDDWDVMTPTNPPKHLPQLSPMSLSSSSPPAFSPSPAHPGLIIPPFPKREGRKDGAICASKNDMDDKNVNNVKNRIFEQLEDFDGNPPFTIQRLCEICIEPRKHYKAVGKYLRALERTILVTSTKDMYLDEVGDEDVEMGMAVWGNESLRTAMTPVFSPIPFLHDDARRSRSPSPFELAATKRPIGPHDDALERPSANSLAGRQGIGLVDELDDPKPGHLADHPTALTTATSAAPPPSLSERFVKSSSPEPELGEFTRDASETVDARQAEDAEVEGMVLNDNVQEDEDKENRPS